MKVKVKNNVDWVGKIDWELKKFHGNEYSTHRGSSYNSYLIREGKTVLIDTVWKPFAKEYVENLKKEIDLNKIDLIIINHSEVDHSGSLPELMRLIPNVPIYCTENAVKSLKGHYHENWNFKTVKTGDKIDIGNGKELVFVEMKMLHWPDSMAVYMTGDNILFSNDAFGQHIASEHLFNDLVVQSELYEEATKYYANILTPFSPLVTKKINEVISFNLPVKFICPSHGIIWRDNPLQIAQKYLEWAADYSENQISIIYDTMWDGTRMLAEHIAKGIKQADDKVTLKLLNISRRDINDVVTEVFKSKAILLGSPTINKGILNAMSALIDMVTGLKFKSKKAAAFGCYGWSGESVKILNDHLSKAGFEVIGEGFKTLWQPGDEALAEALEFGKAFAGKI